MNINWAFYAIRLQIKQKTSKKKSDIDVWA